MWPSRSCGPLDARLRDQCGERAADQRADGDEVRPPAARDGEVVDVEHAEVDAAARHELERVGAAGGLADDQVDALGAVAPLRLRHVDRRVHGIRDEVQREHDLRARPRRLGVGAAAAAHEQRREGEDDERAHARSPSSRPPFDGSTEAAYPARMKRPALIVPLAAVVVAGLSLLVIAPAPSYDPWAWLLWGRELAGGTLDTREGPAFKPLPVAVCTLLAPLGGAAPVVWVAIVRAAAALALWFAFRLGRRLAGGSVWAGLLAAAGVALCGRFLAYSAAGAEPAAAARPRAGRRGGVARGADARRAGVRARLRARAGRDLAVPGARRRVAVAVAARAAPRARRRGGRHPGGVVPARARRLGRPPALRGARPRPQPRAARAGRRPRRRLGGRGRGAAPVAAVDRGRGARRPSAARRAPRAARCSRPPRAWRGSRWWPPWRRPASPARRGTRCPGSR